MRLLTNKYLLVSRLIAVILSHLFRGQLIIKSSTPKTEAELLEKAQNLSGLTLGEIAQTHQVKIPKDLSRQKGWIGLLLEEALGAYAGSRPEPDFPHLGVELKTLPINAQGKPLETTFVCVAPLTGLVGQTWETSHIQNKLSRVLWVPVISERHIPIAERLVGTPFIWSPSQSENALLKADWQELTDMIVLGRVEEINAKHGEILQLRPKAANSRVKTQAYDHKGNAFLAKPRGFYLKTAFTHYLLQYHLRVN